jgi:hypothetical protein
VMGSCEQKFLTSWTTFSLSKRTMLYGVSQSHNLSLRKLINSRDITLYRLIVYIFDTLNVMNYRNITVQTHALGLYFRHISLKMHHTGKCFK